MTLCAGNKILFFSIPRLIEEKRLARWTLLWLQGDGGWAGWARASLTESLGHGEIFVAWPWWIDGKLMDSMGNSWDLMGFKGWMVIDHVMDLDGIWWIFFIFFYYIGCLFPKMFRPTEATEDPKWRPSIPVVLKCIFFGSANGDMWIPIKKNHGFLKFLGVYEGFPKSWCFQEPDGSITRRPVGARCFPPGWPWGCHAETCNTNI